MIKFTIATVTYNAGATIRRTLESVSQQSYDGVEHIIVDGCSGDSTISEVQHYVERNTDERHPHNIVLIREPDNGLYDAMNKALVAAKGDYIIFLNAGDTFHAPTTLSDVAAQLSHYNSSRLPVVIYGETDLVDDNGHFIRHRRLSAPERLTSKSFLDGMLVCHQSFYARTDIARAQSYDLSYRFSSDYDWCIRILKTAERRHLPIHNSKLILTNYLSEGMTTRNHRRSLMERMHIMAKHYGWGRTLAAHVWFCVRSVIRK